MLATKGSAITNHGLSGARRLLARACVPLLLLPLGQTCAQDVVRPVSGESSSGTGFAVSPSGHLLTNSHVVEGCTSVDVLNGAGAAVARVVGRDVKNDLALLLSDTPTRAVVSFRRAPPRAGEDVIAIGYPLHGLLAADINVSVGIVSATAGLRNDTSRLQVSAPVQPGNSGGPLLDNTGALVGVIVSKLNALTVAKAIGDIPQNINFAIKADVAQTFMQSYGVEPRLAQSQSRRATADLAAAARAYTYLLVCDPARQGAERAAARQEPSASAVTVTPPPVESPPAAPSNRLVVIGSSHWCNVSLQRYAEYAECVHLDEQACQRTRDYCMTKTAVNDHNERYPHPSYMPPGPRAPIAQGSGRDSKWEISGDGDWCVIWRRTADCRFSDSTCAGRGTDCRRRWTLN
jgi:S1-C subfamily serine protease